jgi:hypothetical protein
MIIGEYRLLVKTRAANCHDNGHGTSPLAFMVFALGGLEMVRIDDNRNHRCIHTEVAVDSPRPRGGGGAGGGLSQLTSMLEFCGDRISLDVDHLISIDSFLIGFLEINVKERERKEIGTRSKTRIFFSHVFDIIITVGLKPRLCRCQSKH